MWEIITGKYPFQEYNIGQLIRFVHVMGKRPEIPAGTNEDYVALMKRCWDADPTVRPDFPEILDLLEELYFRTKKEESERPRRASLAMMSDWMRQGTNELKKVSLLPSQQ